MSSTPDSLFYETGANLQGAVAGNLFGKPCYKWKGKAFVCLFDGCMVFKLTGNAHLEALGLKGASLFDPSGKGRPMKEWVQVPFEHHQHWPELASQAFMLFKATVK